MGIGAVIGAIADSFTAVATGAATVADVATVAGVTGAALGTVGAATKNQTLTEVGMGLGAAGAVTGLAASAGLFSTAAQAEGSTGLVGGAAKEAATVGAGNWTPGSSVAAAGPAAESGVVPVDAVGGTGAAKAATEPTITPAASMSLAPSQPLTAQEAATMTFQPATAPSKALLNTASEADAMGSSASQVGGVGVGPNGELLPAPKVPGVTTGTGAINTAAPRTPTLIPSEVNPGTLPSSFNPAYGVSPEGLAQEHLGQGIFSQLKPGNVEGWWKSLDPTSRTLIALSGGQALTGLGSGALQSLSMSDQLQLQRLINQEQQNQLQYQNANNRFAPALAFKTTPSTGLLNTAAPALAPVTGGVS